MNDENQELQEAGVVAPRPTFFEALRHLINSYSAENGSNTQDIVLTAFLMNCLDAFNAAVNHRAILSNKLGELPERVRKKYEENDFAQKEIKRQLEVFKERLLNTTHGYTVGVDMASENE